MCIFAVMQANFPQDFVRMVHEHFDNDTADELCSALISTEPEVSIRLNSHKISVEDLLTYSPNLKQVPWCPGAFYLKERPAFTFDPLFHAGAYYVQEASSMYVAEVMRQFVSFGRPLVALDLCAAPGGKSTLLQSLLPNGSLLISNEPIAKRSQILSENIQKWMRGLPNDAPHCMVTQNYPADFAALTAQVDVLLTDVPCSGEGMFRKDEDAVREWSLENVGMCQQRQRDILQDIWHTLKPGGLLIYSTCTFNRFEDEDNTRYICDEMGGFCLLERHFLPGRDRGEGFYVAAIRKNGNADESAEKDVQHTATKVRRTLRVLYDSASSLQPEGPFVELTYDEALQYLRREALRVEAPRGMVTLRYRNLILGQGKGVGSRINNLYPEAWRIRSTYTTPFSILGIEN